MNRALPALLLVFATGVPLAAQLETTPIPTISMKHKHFVFFKCDGQPDKVVGRRDERYFGCVNGRVACSDDGISQRMIAAYERRRADILSGAERRKRGLDAGHGRSTSSRSSTRSASAYTVKSTPRPPAQAEPIEADKVRQVAVGTSTDEVISILGQPKWRIAGSAERWTYSLTSGGSAKIEFAAGKVTSVVLP